MTRPLVQPAILAEGVVGAAVIVGLYLSSLYSYLLFHSLVELFSIIVAAGIFILAWNTRRFMPNGFLLTVGIGMLCVGAVDVLHTLAYSGMGVFKEQTANLPTQLWIVERYLFVATFLAAPLFLARKVNAGLLLGIFAVATGLLLVSIFFWHNFPDCYIDGVGLTPFKKASEYVISFLLLVSLGLLWLKRKALDRQVLLLLGSSIVVGIITDLVFVLYASVYDIANLTGHLFQLVAFYLVYKAIVETGLNRPYELVFRDLKQSELALQEAKAGLESANRALAAQMQERDKADEEIRKLNVDLRHHTDELEIANKELEAFAYSISHDLRAPLRSVEGFSRLLLKEHANELSPAGLRFLELVNRNAADMDALVNGLLTFSRMSRQPLHKQRVDPNEIVRGVLQDLQSEREGRRVDIEIEDLPPCDADPLLIKQVWMNLLSNACKFTRRCDVACIHIGSCKDGEADAYFVKDNGAGFDDEHAERLFGVFQRLHHQEDFEGTGVGLAIVQRIVRRHGGRVWAEAQVDHGATFYFTLG